MRRSEFIFFFSCSSRLVFLFVFFFRYLRSESVNSDKTSPRYHVERLLREVIIPRLAPVSREMCLNYISEKVLDLPKSY